ncbi:hypothetical protein Q7689_15855 [Nocardiopsis tropica]|uniref:hypothetical protein n=1 Tax=Nocardiopsis tropica TaxID=109330 RepID=UPI002E852D96|nr:hypothetical protein [Nocardiopsis tropica]
MNRNFRTTVLALATSGLVVLGSAACSSGEVIDAVADGTDVGEGNEAAVVTEPRVGLLEFIAPGEFSIDGAAFFATEETQILGGLNACPAEDGLDENGFGLVDCDLESLEAAVQGGAPVYAEAEVEEPGNALSITEYDVDGQAEPAPGTAPGDGAAGTDEAPEGSAVVRGELEYIAPGEYMIDGTAFFVAEDTVIYAGIYACAGGVQDPDTGDVICDFDQFDATLANGTSVTAEVQVVEGIAQTITEY